MTSLTIALGDITRQRVDAIVNPANRAMRGGGGVDGAIHRAAGPSLLRECVERFPDGLATGDAGWTPGCELPARWVVHTVGPDFRAGERDASTLASCYRRSLEVAERLGARSIAFPVLSTGIYGWPLGEAVETAIRTVISAEESGLTTADEVRFIAFDEAMLTRLQAMLWLLRPPVPAEGSIGALFDAVPPSTDPPRSELGPYRGDIYLEALLRGRLADTPASLELEEVRRALHHEIERIAGVSLDRLEGDGIAHAAELNPGHGMSAGMLALRWWREVRVPLLLTTIPRR